MRFTKFPIQVGGGLLLIAGTYITAGGLIGVATAFAEDTGLFFPLIVFSPLYVDGAFIAASGIVLLVRGKKYARSKWEYKIVRPIPVTYSY